MLQDGLQHLGRRASGRKRGERGERVERGERGEWEHGRERGRGGERGEGRGGREDWIHLPVIVGVSTRYENPLQFVNVLPARVLVHESVEKSQSEAVTKSNLRVREELFHRLGRGRRGGGGGEGRGRGRRGGEGEEEIIIAIRLFLHKWQMKCARSNYTHASILNSTQIMCRVVIRPVYIQ